MPFALPRTVSLLVLQGVPWSKVRTEMHLRSSQDCSKAYQATFGGETVFSDKDLVGHVALRLRQRRPTHNILNEFDAEVFHCFRLRAVGAISAKEIYCWCELFGLVIEHINRHQLPASDLPARAPDTTWLEFVESLFPTQ